MMTKSIKTRKIQKNTNSAAKKTNDSQSHRTNASTKRSTDPRHSSSSTMLPKKTKIPKTSALEAEKAPTMMQVSSSAKISHSTSLTLKTSTSSEKRWMRTKMKNWMERMTKQWALKLMSSPKVCCQAPETPSCGKFASRKTLRRLLSWRF